MALQYLNHPLLFLQGILLFVAGISYLKDREYVKKYFKTGKTNKRANFWQMLEYVCLGGFGLGMIGQVFTVLVELA